MINKLGLVAPAEAVVASGMDHRTEVKVLTRGPDEGNPTPMRQGHVADTVFTREGVSGGSRRCATVSNESEAP
jgi:hypothetical protein